MKFLIDECLSVRLVEIARSKGFFDSTHVNRLGLSSASDETIVRRAIADNYIVVTNNTRDFVRLVKEQARHPGLVCISSPGGINLHIQTRLFLYALDHLGNRELANQVLRIVLNRTEKVTFDLYEWPPTTP